VTDVAETADATPRLRASQYLGYAAGEVANNLTFQTVAVFVLIYYTDVAGIAASTAGTLLLVARVWGGVTDLFSGSRVDATATRWGRFRPYLLFGSVPLLMLLVATFSIPGRLGDTGTLWWAFVSYALFSLAYSFVNIPYGSLAAAMTHEPDERAKLSSARAVSASVTILLIAVVVAPQIEGSDDLQRSLTVTTSVFAVLGLGLYLWCFATSREAVRSATDKVGTGETLAMIRRNRPLVLLCVSTLLFLTGMFSLSAVAVFYARDVLGNADYYIAMTAVQTVAMVAAAALVPISVGTIGKKRAFVLAGAIGALAALGFAIAPASVPALGIACYGVLGIGFGAINALIFALQADTVEYGEWKSGVRAEGASYALLSLTRKTGQGIGGAAAAYTIGIGGYVSGAASQSDTAITTIRVAAGIVPAVAVTAAAVVMLTYPLTESAFRAMVAQLAERRAAGAVPVPAAGGA
jgi:glucuronide carrier protein